MNVNEAAYTRLFEKLEKNPNEPFDFGRCIS